MRTFWNDPVRLFLLALWFAGMAMLCGWPKHTLLHRSGFALGLTASILMIANSLSEENTG